MYWNFHTIEYFLRSAETHSFSRAAQELHISVQALNRQVLQMEKQLGESLFFRETRSVQLTQTGKMVYEAFAPVAQAYETACKTLNTQLKLERDAIHISFSMLCQKRK